MKKLIISNTELELSPIGLGCVNAGLSWDEEKANRIFDAFLEFGGNVYDTARVYSDWIPPEIGRSERVLGQWLKKSGKRNQVILVTKGGHPVMTGENPDLHINRLSREDMICDVDLSLKALQTDYIDLYFYHRDDVNRPVEELIDTMEGFVKEGKIRYYACSNWTTKRMKEADAYCKKMGYRGFAANQALYNIGCFYMNPQEDDTLVTMDEEMVAYHRENPENLAMPYQGFCSGYFNKLIVLGEEGVKGSVYDTPGNRKIKDRIEMLMEKYKITATQAVLGFFACQDFACLPLYGPRNEANLKEACDTFEVTFEKEDYKGL